MGRWKDGTGNDENHNSERLAAYLGVDHDELTELDYEYEPHSSRDGELFDYIVRFPEDTPQSFIDQLADFEENGHYVTLPIHWDYQEGDEE